MILDELHKIQRQFGHLPEDELARLAERLQRPPYEIYEIASYYPTFRLNKPAEVEVKVCRDLSCQLRDGATLWDAATTKSAANDKIKVSETSCLGRCDRAPVVQVTRCVEENKRFVTKLDATYGGMSAAELKPALDAVVAGRPSDTLDKFRLPVHEPPKPRWLIDIYDQAVYPQAPARYESVRRFARGKLQREAIVAALGKAELEGMGGAAGRAATKWQAVLNQKAQPKYVVCNGDESEPGTFKDRELLLHVPHLIVEAMVLALCFLEATEGFIYIRHEYQEQIAAVRKAIDEATAAFADEKLFSGPLPFQLTVVESPGGYICGEQSALLEAIEGKRAQPRCQNSVSAIQTNGLNNKPTILNNVETLAWVPAIVSDGGAWYAEQGFRPTESPDAPTNPDLFYKGRRFFSLSGDVARPGVYEVPCGMPLRTLIEETQYGGGLRNGQKLRAVATSGPSGGFLPPQFEVAELLQRLERSLGKKKKGKSGNAPSADDARARQQCCVERFRDELAARSGVVSVLDLELASPVFRALGLSLGAGIIVYGDRSLASMLEPALGGVEFFQRESCGKCVPCRLGTQQLVELGRRLHDPQQDRSEIQRTVQELKVAMELTSICGLGRFAANPLKTYLEFF